MYRPTQVVSIGISRNWCAGYPGCQGFGMVKFPTPADEQDLCRTPALRCIRSALIQSKKPMPLMALNAGGEEVRTSDKRRQPRATASWSNTVTISRNGYATSLRRYSETPVLAKTPSRQTNRPA